MENGSTKYLSQLGWTKYMYLSQIEYYLRGENMNNRNCNSEVVIYIYIYIYIYPQIGVYHRLLIFANL